MKRHETSYGTYSSKFQAYVVYVDQNSTIGDKQKEGTIQSFSPQTGRNLHIGVIRLNGEGAGLALNVLVPTDVLGEFKMPSLGDVVWVEESRREIGTPPIYMYSTYNNTVSPDKIAGSNPVPQWGSFPGDIGHITSYRDHIKQFVPSVETNFKKKYIKSVSGYRFRRFYKSNLEAGRYVMRGDSVFDIDGSVSRDYLIEDGAYIGYGGDLEDDQGRYPNPLNAPSSREEDEDYTYANKVFEPIDRPMSGSQYDNEEEFSEWKPTYTKSVLHNKNYLSYQPVMDKTYLEEAEFERELPAAEEYQVSLRGNNKLLIQDQHGDGEHLLITLKNQYDAGFTIVHNAERGQVRLRDHLGQGVLLEADPDAPRVISWTANRQVIEQGSVKDVGEFTYIRNGSAFGDSETSFGTKTGLTKDDVSNQEFLMVSNPEIITELGSRLSTGMSLLATRGYAAGIYIRNNTDPDDASQEYSMYKDGSSLVVEFLQENLGVDGAEQSTTLRQSMNGSDVTQFSEVRHTSPAVEHFYNETVLVSNSGASKNQEMTRAGSDTITLVESISGDNTAQSVKTIHHVPSGDRTVTSYNGAEYTIQSFTTPGLQAEVTASPSSLVSTKYLNGGELSAIEQTNSSIDVRRTALGSTIQINVGNDGQPGPIVIGNSSSVMTISGTKTISGPTNFTNP